VDPAVIVTLVVSVAGVIFASVTAPLILAHRTERMHREDQLEQYRREDKVAAAAAAAAAAAQAAARLAQQQALEAATKMDDLSAQTQRIHTLVNSDMTAARQEELDQAESLIVVLERVIALAKDRVVLPDPSDLDALERTKRRRDQLEAILADRLAQFHASETEAGKTEAGKRMLATDIAAGKEKP
jgi:CRISPR/Cas system CMR subunit Cmr4 (Cas7 group RAMP superfamily)